MAATGYAQIYYPVDLDKAIRAIPLNQWTEKFEAAKNSTPGFEVQSIEEFIKINEYYKAILADGNVTHTFRTKYSEQIHCIEITSQASIRAAGLDPNNIPLAPTKVPAGLNNPKKGTSGSVPVVDFGLDGSLDTTGQVRKCPDGSFPKLIRPIETFYQFKTLKDVFRKYPEGHTPPFLGSGKSGTKETHEYGVAYSDSNHTGEIADFNLWSPYVPWFNEFSLSQLWVSRGSGSDLQTAELGWQVYPVFYGNQNANLFIFFTPDNYQSGCYNLDCAGFVQTDPSVIIAGGFPNYSSVDGTQYHVSLGFIRDGSGGNHWWLKFDDKWVGYYPNSIYDNQGIAEYSDNVNFGGEIIDSLTGGNHTVTEMGSGLFPSEGYGRAAFIKKIQYVNLSDVLLDASNLYTYATVPTCWKVSNAIYSSDAAWKTNFYFGGACDQNPDDDDDDNDDNDATDDDTTDDDTTDDDDADDDSEDDDSAADDCSWLIQLTYNDCGLKFLDSGKTIPSAGAYQLCLEGGNPWDCISECANDDSVTGCKAYASCLEQKCQVSIKKGSSGGSGDDDEEEKSCGS